MIRNIARWTLLATMAVVAALTLSPTSAFARGGGGGGGRGGSRGGSRGGRGGSRGGRGGSRGASRGGRGGSGKKAASGANKNPITYLELLQREEAQDFREDFIFEARDQDLVVERDKTRARDLTKERDAAAAERRVDQEAGSHPY